MQSTFTKDNLENKTTFEERLIQLQRGQTKGVVIDTIDKTEGFLVSVTKSYTAPNFANSIAGINDGAGTIFLKVVKTDNQVFDIKIETNETFDEVFGDIKTITVNSTSPYRMIVRG
jgi:hypothetical protein